MENVELAGMVGVLGSMSLCFTEREKGTVRLEEDSHEKERERKPMDGYGWLWICGAHRKEWQVVGGGVLGLGSTEKKKKYVRK